jgi:hypothetical protein
MAFQIALDPRGSAKPLKTSENIKIYQKLLVFSVFKQTEFQEIKTDESKPSITNKSFDQVLL